ncbi:MAG: TorF family putative porin [Woeseiaceae bacterium]
MSSAGRLLRMAGFLCGGLQAMPAGAADPSAYLVLTTDYVFRGVTYSDGHPAVQGGADLALDGGVYFGIWASSVDLSNGPTRQRDLEVNYYLGYSHELHRDWTLDVNAIAYAYPGTEGDIDYDYFEYSIAANYKDRAWLEYSYSPDLFHSARATHHVELYAEWPLPGAFLLGAGAGYYDVSALAGSGYAYWQLGVTRPAGRFDIDLRYHDASRAVAIISTEERAEARIVLSARLSF